MKRTVVVLATALVLALAAPMAFAASIDISGQAETRFEFKQDQTTNEWGLHGKHGLKLSPKMQVGDNIELGVDFEVDTKGMDSKNNPTEDFANGLAGALNPGVAKVWMKSTGPFWQGGPDLTTTIGDQTINWNEWVAHMGDVRGVAVEGMDLMVADADVFYAWDADPAQRTLGLRIGSEYAGVDMNGALAYRGGKVNLAAAAATDLNGIDVDGVLALDEDFRYAFKVNAAMNPMEDVTLTAGYRQMQAGFAPMHARTDGGHIVPFHKDSDDAGFNVGVETVQSGFVLGATYDQPTNEAGVSAARTFDVYNHAIDTKYAATFAPGGTMKHELSASTTTDAVPYVPGIGLNAKVGLEGTDFSNVSYELNSTYTAPNGITLGAGYSSDAGAVLSGGLKVQF